MTAVALRRLTLLVSAIVLVDMAFYAVVAPLLPHYTHELGLSKVSAGILTAAYPAGAVIGSLPCGLLAARAGPKITALLGLALIGLSSLAFGVVHDIVLLDGARFVQGLGGACSWAGGLGWLIAEAPVDRRGALIGTALGAAIGGELFGPVLGALAQASSTVLVFSGVAAIAAGLAVWAAVTPSAHRPRAQTLGDVVAAASVADVRTAIWLVTLPALGFGGLTVLGPLRLSDLGYGSLAVGAVFLAAAVVEGIESPMVGRISDRRGRLVPIRFGLGAAAALLCLFTLPQTGLLFGALLVITTASLGVFWAPAMALLSDAADGVGLAQGMAFALTNLGWGLGQATGAAGSGVLADLTSDAVPLGLCALACAWTLVLLTRRGVLRSVALESPEVPTHA